MQADFSHEFDAGTSDVLARFGSRILCDWQSRMGKAKTGYRGSSDLFRVCARSYGFYLPGPLGVRLASLGHGGLRHDSRCSCTPFLAFPGPWHVKPPRYATGRLETPEKRV